MYGMSAKHFDRFASVCADCGVTTETQGKEWIYGRQRPRCIACGAQLLEQGERIKKASRPARRRRRRK